MWLLIYQLRISSIVTPLANAADVAAPRTEWALNVPVSTPASSSMSLIQWAIHWTVIGWCGFMYERISGLESLFTCQNSSVTFS